MLGPWRHWLLLSWSRLSSSLSALVVKESAASQSCITRSGAGNLRHEIEVGPKWIGKNTESAKIAFTSYGGLCVKPTTNASWHLLLSENCRTCKLSGTLVLLSDNKLYKSDAAKFDILAITELGKKGHRGSLCSPLLTRYTVHRPHFHPRLGNYSNFNLSDVFSRE